MNWQIAIGLFVVFDLLVLTPGIIWAVVRVGWSPWMRVYPPLEPSPDAVRRNFQSFRFGLLNFGLSIHVAADDEHLHLIPAKLLRWCSARPISIPWDRIQVEKRSSRRTMIQARVDGKQLMGPAWCLELADPAAGDAGAAGDGSRDHELEHPIDEA